MLLVAGQIARPHGIRGEVLVDIRTDEPEHRFAAGSVLATDVTEVTAPAARRVPPALTVEAARPHLGRLIVQFDGVYDRDLAEELRGVLLCVDSADVPRSDDPDEFHDHELVGLTAVDTDGASLGEVVAVDHAPASELLVVRLNDGRRALVPFVSAIVPEVDLAGRRVVLTPPEGLFDL
jgi:16S rRNA processing protein RimM